MECPECGLFNPDTAEACDCGHRFDTSNAAPKDRFHSRSGSPNQIAVFVLVIVVLGAVLTFFLSFHIVSHSGGISLIPKDHLSFADTFVNIDHLIREYNERTLGEKLRGEGVNLYLIRKLKDKGIVSLTADKTPSQNGRSITKAMYDPSLAQSSSRRPA